MTKRRLMATTHIFTCEKPTSVGVSVADAVGCNKRDYSSVWKLNYPLSILLIDVIFLWDLEIMILI